jgi:hypothetical protein
MRWYAKLSVRVSPGAVAAQLQAQVNQTMASQGINVAQFQQWQSQMAA